MGSLRFPELDAELGRGRLRPIYYLTGDEDVLKDEAVRAIAERALGEADRTLNLDDRLASEVDAESLTALMYTPPLLASRRVVVLRGVETLRRKPKMKTLLLRYLESPPPDAVFILVEGSDQKTDEKLQANAARIECDRPSPDEAAAWLERRASAIGLRLESDAAADLLAAGGGSIAALEGELAKLAAAVGDAPVTADQVAALVGVRRGETLGDFVAAVMARKTAPALALVEPVLEQPGVNGVRCIMALGTALVGTRVARGAADAGAKGRRLGDAVFQAIRRARPAGLGSWRDAAAAWSTWAPHWTDPELASAIERALEADQALKSSGVSDERAILRQFVLSTRRQGAAA